MHLVGQPDIGEHAAHLIAPGRSVGDLLEHGDVIDEVVGAEVAVQTRLLREVPEPPTDRQPLGGDGRVETKDSDRAAVLGQHRGEHPQQRALAGAIRAEQADHAAPT